MYLSKYIFVLATLLIFAGCYPDTEESTETIIKPVRKTVIASAKTVINVTDENGQPLTGLTARFNQQSKIINQASFFQFDAKNIYKENELLSITDTDGQVYEYSLYNIENQVNYHNVTLFRNTNKQVFSTSEGSVISFPSGKMAIDLTNTGLTSGNGAYAGQVNCIYHEFDLNNPYHLQAIPGGKLIDIDGKYHLVEWLYVFRFDLLTQNEKYLALTNPKNVFLNISPEKQARIIQYDRSKKFWTDLGTFSDTKNLPIQSSGIYAVVHTYEPSALKGIFTANDLPLVKQKITYDYDGKRFETQTTNTGKWEILVPKNQSVSIQPVTDCSDLQNGITVSANETTVETGIKNFNTQQIRNITLKGSFKNCFAKDLPEGFIQINQNTKTEYIYIPESDFEWTIPICDDGVLSFGAAGNAGEKMANISFDNDIADLGNIFLCSGLENQYISLRTPDGNTLYTGDIIVTGSGSETSILFKSTTQEFLITFINNQQPGLVATETGNIVWKDQTFLNKGIEINCPTSNTCGFEEIRILSQQHNDWIKGSFKGNFWSKTLQPLTAKNQILEGDFFIKR
ncbi:MAG: hypothetical protein IPN79_11470 [Saprospiraceae bacterium]|nr:hypothetical protein [Saprospiraceae bacterium]